MFMQDGYLTCMAVGAVWGGGRDRCRRRWRCGMSVLERGWGIMKSGGIGRFDDRFVWNRILLLGESS